MSLYLNYFYVILKLRSELNAESEAKEKKKTKTFLIMTKSMHTGAWKALVERCWFFVWCGGETIQPLLYSFIIPSHAALYPKPNCHQEFTMTPHPQGGSLSH